MQHRLIGEVDRQESSRQTSMAMPHNTASGSANDAYGNKPENHGYDCYGLNVGIGNLNDAPEKAKMINSDSHQVKVFEVRALGP